MKHIETIKGLRKSLHEVKTGVAGDTTFSAKAVLFIAEQLDQLIQLAKKGKFITAKPKRKRFWLF